VNHTDCNWFRKPLMADLTWGLSVPNAASKPACTRPQPGHGDFLHIIARFVIQSRISSVTRKARMTADGRPRAMPAWFSNRSVRAPKPMRADKSDVDS
jgi:hypothetical protein